MTKPFLTASWKNLVFFNYIVSPSLLLPYVPAGTELDDFEGKYYSSLVGFLFQQTRMKGLAIPFHSSFEEFNLRFYVRFKSEDKWKRGVVFVKEIVPKRMVASIARFLYGEHYYCFPMKNSLSEHNGFKEVSYSFLFKKEWNDVHVKAAAHALPLAPGSEQAFITEHYDGFTKLAVNKTSHYRVEHPVWNIHEVFSWKMNCNIPDLYGANFGEALNEPCSVFMADGSLVKVYPRKVYSY